VTFDAPLSAPTSLDSLASTPASTVHPGNSGGFDFGAGAASDVASQADTLLNLIRKTPLGSIAPNAMQHVENVLSTMKAGDPNADAQTKLGEGAGNAASQLTGFFLGDEALKGLSVADRLLEAGKMAKVVEKSPLLTRIVSAAIRGGTVGGVQNGLTSGTGSGALTGAITGALGAPLGEGIAAAVPGTIDAVGSAAGKASDAMGRIAENVKAAIKPGVVQDALQADLRNILNDAAKEAGVNPSASQSIRDVANDVSNAVQSKAKSAYDALDEATGGRVQRFKDAVKNVQQKIRELNGIDPDQEGAYVEKLNDLQAAHEKAMDEASTALKAQGKTQSAKQLLDQANSDFRKSSALLDTSKQIQSSVEGLRPEYAAGANRPIPEKINTGKLFAKLNKMDNPVGTNPSRLQQALGPERTKTLMQTANDAHDTAQAAQHLKALAGTTAKHIGWYSGAGLTYEILRHMLLGE
jgi:hypothetical protein